MPRKPASDSVQGRMMQANPIDVVFNVPEGLESLDIPEQRAWDQYISAKDGWKSSDLRQLHALVKLESRVAVLEAEALETPAVYEKGNGDFAAHPVHNELRAAIKLAQAQVRMLGMQTPVGKGQGKNAVPGSRGRGKKASVSLLK